MWLPPKLLIQNGYLSLLLVSLRDVKWGAWSLIALYISLFSGVVVGLQYDYSTPYYSVGSIDVLVPYGEFFRSLHFYSSQVFFFFSVFHLAAIYPQTENFGLGEWLKLLSTLPVILLLLFTGYILRGDSTGSSAGMIAENIMHTIPVVGTALNTFLFSIEESGLRRVYVHHVIGLDILLLVVLWKHLRSYRIENEKYLPVAGFTLLFCMFISAPIEPDHPGVTYISGPWFFLGLQELLRYLDPFFAGVVIPSLFLVFLLGTYPKFKGSHVCLCFMWAWLFFYLILTTLAWLR
jgi:hypothetical protein